MPSRKRPSDAINSMLGGWEMSNADRDKTCIITFKLDMTGPGRALDLPKDCTTTFPNIKDVAAWTIDNDALRSAASQLNCNTFYGRFQIDRPTGKQLGHRVCLVRWRDSAKTVLAA